MNDADVLHSQVQVQLTNSLQNIPQRVWILHVFFYSKHLPEHCSNNCLTLNTEVPVALARGPNAGKDGTSAGPKMFTGTAFRCVPAPLYHCEVLNSAYMVCCIERSGGEEQVWAEHVESVYAYGDRDVISMPAGFRRHLVGKTLVNFFHCDIAEICFVGELVIIQTFS